MRTVVLYHAPCADGMAAAWAAWRSMPDAELVPSAYDTPRDPSAYAGCDVYMVDFSWPRADVEALLKVAHHLTILDHHKSAVENLSTLQELPVEAWDSLDMVLDQTHSGAYLAWHFFRPLGEDVVPNLIRYVEDRDLWRWQLWGSRSISAWLRTFELTVEAYDRAARLLSSDVGIQAAFDCGSRILALQDIMAKAMADTCCFQTFAVSEDRSEVVVVPVVNCPQATMLQSETCEELLRRYPGVPFAAAWCAVGNDRRQWSLRSRPTPDGACFDVSALARRQGGGGHHRAAGYTQHSKD